MKWYVWGMIWFLAIVAIVMFWYLIRHNDEG